MSHAQDAEPRSAAVARVGELTAQLVSRGVRYFGTPVDRIDRVQLLRCKTRPRCTLYEFMFEFGTERRRVLVKVPRFGRGASDGNGSSAPGSSDRPRLFAPMDQGDRAEIEFGAMARIQEHFEAAADPRFGVIQVYDLLPDPRAIVMELSEEPSLSTLLFTKSRWQGPFSRSRLGTAIHNSGAWLESYHHLPGLAHTRTRHTERRDFSGAIEALMDFLKPHRASGAFVSSVRDSVLSGVERFLPDALPIGTVHGDYAPRNILVGAAGRVRVLDTLARWRAPIYEDIAQFLIGLKAHRLQVYSQGLFLSSARLDRYEDRFLRGYFGSGPLPVGSIRLFECLVALEKWCAVVHGFKPSYSLRGLGRRFAVAAWVRYLRRTIERLLYDLERCEPSCSQEVAIRPVA